MRIYTGHLCDDKLNTQRFIQSGRKLKFQRNKRANRRSFFKQKELKTMEMVMLELMESWMSNLLFLLLEPVNRGFSSHLSQLYVSGAVCFSTQTVYLSSGR